LGLLERQSGPILEDYEKDAPSAAADEEPWSCPLPLPPLQPAKGKAERLTQALQSEVSYLLPWYGEAIRTKGRTLFGLSGLTVESVSDMSGFVAAFAAGESPAPPDGTVGPMPAALRAIIDDLKTLYLEAAAAQPGKELPDPYRLNGWLYHETRFGALLYDIRDRLAREAEAASTAPQSGRPPAIAIIPNAFRDRPMTG
jgi:hypothetical protein